VVWALFVGVLCVASSIRYLGGEIAAYNVSNADMLAVPAVVEAVATDGVSVLGRWYWPPAPYFVLDFLVYVPVWLALPDAWLAPALFMVVQLSLLAAGLTLLAAAALQSPLGAPRVRWSAASSFAVLVAVAGTEAQPVRFLLASYYRGGSLVLALLVLARVLRRPPECPIRRRALSATAIVLFAALCAISDPLLVPAALIPAAAVVAVRNVWDPLSRATGARSAAWWPVLALAVGSIVGLAANRRLLSTETGYGPSLRASSPILQLQRLADVFRGFDDALIALWIGAFALLAAAAFVRQRRSGSRVAEPFSASLAFCALSVAGHVAGVMVDTTAPAPRYLIVAIVLPIALVGPAVTVLVAERAATRPLPARVARVLAMAVWAVASLAVLVPAAGALDDVRLDVKALEAACLDDLLTSNEVHTGLAGYWEARTVQVHSDHPRRVAHVTGFGVPFKANSAMDWYEEEWTFAVVGSAGTGFEPPLDLIRAYAPGAEELTCGNYTVLRFDGIDPQPLDEPGETVRWSGCLLRTQIAEVRPSSCRMQIPAGSSGFGFYGGYTPLPPGEYRITLSYGSAQEATSTDLLASFEIARVVDFTAGSEIVQAVDLRGTSGAERELRVALTVSDDGRPFVIETRTFTDGTYGYHVDGVVIERMSAE
jgi:hypothetical protein